MLEFQQSAWDSHPGLNISTYWNYFPRCFPEPRPKWEKWVCYLITFEYTAAVFATARKYWWTLFPCGSDKLLSTYPSALFSDNQGSKGFLLWQTTSIPCFFRCGLKDRRMLGFLERICLRHIQCLKISVLLLPQLTCNDYQEFLSQKQGQMYWPRSNINVFSVFPSSFSTLDNFFVLIIKLLLRKDSVYTPTWWTCSLLGKRYSSWVEKS